jgi:hypothetical protein
MFHEPIFGMIVMMLSAEFVSCYYNQLLLI